MSPRFLTQKAHTAILCKYEIRQIRRHLKIGRGTKYLVQFCDRDEKWIKQSDLVPNAAQLIDEYDATGGLAYDPVLDARRATHGA